MKQLFLVITLHPRIPLFFYFAFFVSRSCFAVHVWAEEPELITMAPLTSQVQARYYAIERLQKAVQALYTVHHKHPKLTKLPDTFFNTPLSQIILSQVAVAQCLKQMRTQQTIEPFFELWRQIRAYKYIDAPALALEFSQLLWRIMNQITAQLTNLDTNKPGYQSLALYRALEQLELHAQETGHTVDQITDPDIFNTPSSPAIAFRFYLIRRLEAVHAYLTEYQKTTCAKSATHKPNNNTLCSAEHLFTQTEFTNPQIIAYKNRLQKEKNLAPLLHLLADIQQFKSTENVAFAQEALQLIFVIYKAISNQDTYLTGNTLENSSANHQDTIPLATLSIEELLDSIDIMTENIAEKASQEKVNAAADFAAGQALCSACSTLWHYATNSFSKTHTRTRDSLSISEIVEQDYGFTANQFTNYIYRRFYFIKRLEKIMDTFSRLNKTLVYENKRINIDRIFDVDNTESFMHPMIKKSLNTIKTKRNLRPLFTVWDSFKSYRLIEDQLLIEEFTKEIFVISRNLLLSSLEAQNLETIDLEIAESRQQLSLCSCCLLDLIDAYIDKFLSIQPEYKAQPDTLRYTRHFFGSLPSFCTRLWEMTGTQRQPEEAGSEGGGEREAGQAVLPTQVPHKYLHTLHDLKPLIHMDDIVERFYHVNRLERIMSQIYVLHKKGYVYQLPNSIKIKNNEPFSPAFASSFFGLALSDCAAGVSKGSHTSAASTITIDNRIQLTHPDIVSCIKVMEQTQSWTPLLQLLCEVKRYKFIQDHIFIRELSYLLFTVGHTTLISEAEKHKNLDLDQLAQVYETIDSLPLENILDAIDLLSDQIPLLLEKYAFDEKTPTWLSWFRKNWWHASVDALKLTIKVLLTLKPSHILNALLGRENVHHNYHAYHGQYGQQGQNNGYGNNYPEHNAQDIDQIFRHAIL